MKNESGIYPKGDRILILPDDIDKRKVDSVIEIPEWVEEQHAMAQSIGVLVEAGPDAWTDHIEVGPEGVTRRGFLGPFAAPGDRVCFAKYGGIQVEGKDGKLYRIMNDVDITATVDEGVSFTDLKSRKGAGL